MAKSTQSAGGRFLKLAGMTASITRKAVSHQIKSMVSSEEQKLIAKSELYTEIGLQITKTLGEMKGAVMKVGQMFSQFNDILPPEIAQAITALQREAPPMPFADIQFQVERELGKPLLTIFKRFEEVPFAAASIGQVHRAELHSGEHVVVKVQYVGVDEACDSDLKQLRLALRLAGVLNIDKNLQDQLFKEFADTLHEELDYRLEAQNLVDFTEFHAKHDPKIIIPKVYPEYSSKRVLTLSEEAGDNLDTAKTFPQEVRDEIGYRLFKMVSDQMFKFNRFHCDPHPGNFAFKSDGSVVVYDFGGVKKLDQKVTQAMIRLIHAGIDRHTDRIENALRDLQVRTTEGQIPAVFYDQWLSILLDPMLTSFDFGESQIHHKMIGLIKESFKYRESFQPSPLTLMSNRNASGHYWNLVHLGVKQDFKTLTYQYI